ncbi:MAG: hypothetical protein SNJ71_06500 [Bacteroidales bacterium]
MKKIMFNPFCSVIALAKVIGKPNFNKNYVSIEVECASIQNDATQRWSITVWFPNVMFRQFDVGINDFIVFKGDLVVRYANHNVFLNVFNGVIETVIKNSFAETQNIIQDFRDFSPEIKEKNIEKIQNKNTESNTQTNQNKNVVNTNINDNNTNTDTNNTNTNTNTNNKQQNQPQIKKQEPINIQEKQNNKQTFYKSVFKKNNFNKTQK